MSDEGFPFLGAGEARHFESAWMIVKLARAPKPAEREAITLAAPAPFALRFSRAFVSAETSEDVHLAVSASYDADPDDEDELAGDRLLAASSRFRRFSEDIERWLKSAHAIVPIVVAVRPEDGEAGGTELSEWHRRSLAQLPAILEGFAKTAAKKRGRGIDAQALEAILELAEAAGAPIPEAFVRWWKPELALATTVRAGDAAKVAAALRELGDGAAATLSDALALLELDSPSDRAAILAAGEALRPHLDGWVAMVAARALESADPASDGQLLALAGAGGAFGHSASDAFVRASIRPPEHVSLRLCEAGALALPDASYLLAIYLGKVIGTKSSARVNLTLLARALSRASDPLTIVNATAICYERGEPERGIELVERCADALPDAALLNAALLYVLAGQVAEARRYAARAAKSGDRNAKLIEPAALLAEGDTDGALRALEALHAARHPQLRAWKDDRVFAALEDEPRWVALFAR